MLKKEENKMKSENIKEMVYTNERKFQILLQDTLKDFTYYIVSHGTHPCAYVKLPKGSKLFGKTKELEDSIDCHGGITYMSSELPWRKNVIWNNRKSNWYIGWDYCHYNDYAGYFASFDSNEFSALNNQVLFKRYSTYEIIDECEQVINQLIALETTLSL